MQPAVDTALPSTPSPLSLFPSLIMCMPSPHTCRKPLNSATQQQQQGRVLCLCVRARLSAQVLRVSLLYETAPQYVTEQPAYLNAAVLAHTDLSPLQLLYHLKKIEKAAGVQGAACGQLAVH